MSYRTDGEKNMVKKIREQHNPVVQFILDNVGCNFNININGTVVEVPYNITISADKKYLHLDYNDIDVKCLIKLDSVDSISAVGNGKID